MDLDIRGYRVIVDECLWESIQNAYSWQVQPENESNGSLPYIYRLEKRNSEGKRKRKYLHRILLNAKDGEVVDHINGNTLDNRVENLRITTHSGNQRNKIGTSSTGYKGVSYDNSTGRYQAKITIQGKTVMLGRKNTAKEASELYKEAAIEYYGEYARFDCKNKQGV